MPHIALHFLDMISNVTKAPCGLNLSTPGVRIDAPCSQGHWSLKPEISRHFLGSCESPQIRRPTSVLCLWYSYYVCVDAFCIYLLFRVNMQRLRARQPSSPYLMRKAFFAFVSWSSLSSRASSCRKCSFGCFVNSHSSNLHKSRMVSLFRLRNVCVKRCQLPIWWFSYIDHAMLDCLCLSTVIGEGVRRRDG